MYTFEDFCDGGLWNTSLLLDNTWPQVTPCFLSLVRIWVPCLYVWLLLPLFIKSLREGRRQADTDTGTGTDDDRRTAEQTRTTTSYTGKQRKDDVTTTEFTPSYQALYSSDNEVQSELDKGAHRLQKQQQQPPPTTVLRSDGGSGTPSLSLVATLKIVLVLLEAIVTSVEVIRLLVTQSGLMDVLSGFLLLASYLLLCFMLWYEKRKKGASSSYIFFYFFAMELVLGAVNMYMWIFIWGIENAVFPFTNVVIQYGLNIVCLVLTFFDDNKTRDSRQDYQTIGRPDCPEMTSPYPSQIFFTWMRCLMMTGFRHDLTHEDVWKINPRDTSAQLSPVFERLWADEVQRVKRINKKRQSVNRERLEHDKNQSAASHTSQSVHYSNNDENTRLLDSEVSVQDEEIKEMADKFEVEICHQCRRSPAFSGIRHKSDRWSAYNDIRHKSHRRLSSGKERHESQGWPVCSKIHHKRHRWKGCSEMQQHNQRWSDCSETRLQNQRWPDCSETRLQNQRWPAGSFADYTTCRVMEPLFFNCMQAQRAYETRITPSVTNKKAKGTRKPRKEKAEPNLFLVMAKLLWKEILIGLIKRTFGDAFMFMGPLILGALINFLQNYDESKVWQAYALSVILLLTGLTKSVLFAQSMYAGSLVGLKYKTILTTAIYKKALTISGAAKKNTTVGEMVNLMSVDCQRLQEMMAMFLFTWSTPFQLLMATFLLYQTLGVSMFAGVFLMALTIPINYMLSNKQRVLQTDILDLKDDRIRLVNEIINGMKVLKFYAWELEFKKKVEAIRALEIRNLFRIANIFIVLNTMAGLLPFLVGFVTFFTYLMIDRDNVLDASKAFVSLALFNLLRVPMIYIATAIVFSVQSVVCTRRINKFLNSEDLDPSTVSHDHTNKYALEIKSGIFSWVKKGRPVLNNINVQIPEGSLVAVIGPIGSGKSSLISSFLGDVYKQQGQVNVKGRVGYVSQQAWIQNATVRENIVFGGEYSRRRYNATIKACQLISDFEILDGGDQTEIGEKGINISGGQKQRINLARAAYSHSDIFLFDDPLSAVDAHVGKAIFEELIGPDGSLAGKTRVLVTHGLQWLPRVDKIIVLSEGRITAQGSYTELLTTSKHFSELINLYTTEPNPQPDLVANTALDAETFKHLQKQSPQTQVEQEQRSNRKLSEPTRFQDSIEFETSCTMVTSVKSIHPESSKLTVTEFLEKGKISTDVYTTFVKAAGAIAIPVSFVCYVLYNACLILSNFWLAEWTEVPILLNESTRTSEEAISTSNYFMLIYGLFGVGQAVMHLLHCVLFWYGMVRAGHRLHSLLLERLFHAPMAFFDQTPVGRILNRFSRDVDIVDNNLPLIIKDFIITSFWVLGTIVVVMVKTPIFGVVLIPLMIFFWMAQNFYVRTSRQLKRMESIARSPVYTHFSETVTGASAIRAYGATQRFIAESEDRIDENQVYYFASQAAIRWLQLNMDVLANMAVLFAALFQVLDGGGGSDAGLSVTYALQITGIMTYMVRQVCEFETNIVCVERMKEYSRIEQEAALSIPSKRPPNEWPQEGNVEFCDYQLRYRPGLQLVLKGVSCSIRKAEKVGIVGRTGAGKSSLTLGLFRIIEAAGGLILIDGVNIANIGLHDLRKKLTILPQDPVLFSGSLRMNIDPFNEFTDDKLWLALERSHLKDFVAGQPDGLMHECGEEGMSLSVGQRQLVCLARALLRKTRVLILDEATAAVDLETDALIQATIRKAFHDCTVLAIAHRLQTIMDYDKVIVMDVGVVKEFDSPELLIEQRGVFYSMCKDAGLA